MFNVIKCYKVKKTTLTKVSNHTHRTKLTEAEQKRIDLTKTSKNRILVGSNVSADVRNRIKNYSTNKTRKDAVYAEHYVLSASPEFFVKNPDKKEFWIKEQIKFLKNEFGENLVTAVLHDDESTPHIEAFVTPIIDNKLNRKEFNKLRGGLNSFTKLQTKHAEHNKKFGLERGVSKEITGVTSTNLDEYYKNVTNYSKKLKKLVQQAPDDLMPMKKMGFVYTQEDVLNSIEKALKITNKTYVKAISKAEVYKNNYIKIFNKYKALKLKFNKLLLKNKELQNEVKLKNDIAEQLKPLVKIGEKVVNMGLESDINKRYEEEFNKTNEIAYIVKGKPERSEGLSEANPLITHKKPKL